LKKSCKPNQINKRQT